MKDAVGVIGGIGPAATAYFMERVIALTDAQRDQDHIDMVIFNHASIPDRTAYIVGQGEANPLPVMMEDARQLEALGCRFIVIPCNTAHYFYSQIQEEVSIPVVNIVAETIDYARHQIAGLETVGILATTGTIRTNTYQRFAEEAGLRCVVPDAALQQRVMDIIYEGVKANQPVSREAFEAVAEPLRAQGAQCLILGCTELSVLKGELQLDAADILDSIDVLAAETVRRAEKGFSQAAHYLKKAGVSR